MLVYLGALKFYFFFHESTAGLSFFAFYSRIWELPRQKIMGVLQQSWGHFWAISGDFQTLEGIGTAHIQLLKSWKNYYDTVYKAEEKLD